MAQPTIGEIRMFGGNFAPNGWLFCEGQLIPISENDALFSLIGRTYGGDEQSFALPDLRGRVPIHQGNGFTLAEAAGVEVVTLTTQQIPVHNHAFLCSTANALGGNPQNAVLGQSASVKVFLEDVPNANLAANAIIPVGGSQPHTNLQPYLCVNFIISLFGLYPFPT